EVRMTTAVLLVLLGALSRLIPHPPNFVALGALALYAGARLPRRWAFVVPLGAMAVADVVIDFGSGRAVFAPTRVAIYGAFALIVVVGRFARGRTGPFRLAGLSVGASLLFFPLPNLAEWVGDPMYSK